MKVCGENDKLWVWAGGSNLHPPEKNPVVWTQGGGFGSALVVSEFAKEQMGTEEQKVLW